MVHQPADGWTDNPQIDSKCLKNDLIQRDQGCKPFIWMRHVSNDIYAMYNYDSHFSLPHESYSDFFL